VVEEENGGNGTLGMVRAGDQANAAIVMEPTSGAIVISVRGAVWFRINTHGTAGHSGQTSRGVSALDLAFESKQLLEKYHRDLLSQSKGIQLFDAFSNPMPITFGKLHSGEWPAMIPDSAVMEGVMGFLPNCSRDQIMAELRSHLENHGSESLSKGSKIEFMYRHDCHVIDPQAQLVTQFTKAIRRSGATPVITAFPASCDSWYYNNLLQIPTIVFGAGQLANAHTESEHIRLDEIEEISVKLAHFAHVFSEDALTYINE